MSFAMPKAVAMLATLLGSTAPTLRPGDRPEPKLRITLRPATGMPMRIHQR